MAYRCLAKVMFTDPGNDPKPSTANVCCNGRMFYIEMSSQFFANSPRILARYRRFLDALREEGEFAEEDIATTTPHPAVFLAKWEAYFPPTPATGGTARQRWVDQLRESVDALHKAGLVWGDAKADNVLIDEGNTAWLIDLGGGYTEGWVDKDKAGTEEGDRQGVERIAAYLMDDGRFAQDGDQKDV